MSSYYVRIASAMALALLMIAGTTTLAIAQQDDSPGVNDPITVVAMGDSLTVGTGSTSGYDYVSQLSRQLGSTVINAGVSGDTTQTALDRLNSDVLSRNPDIVIVFLGGNDLLQNVPANTTFANLKEIVEDIQAADAQVILVAAHRDVFITQWESRFRALANETDSYYVSGALNGVLGNPKRLSDVIHPNNEGYKLVTDRIWPILQDAIEDRYPGRDLSVQCLPWPSAVYLGNSVTWEAYAIGGERAGNYTFTWEGDESLSGSGRTRSVRYEDVGNKSASVTAKSGDDTVQNACAMQASVQARPLVGLCEVEIDIEENQGENDVSTVWNARAAGGTGEYAFAWSGGVTGSVARVEQTHTTSGIKEGTVTITSGTQTISLDCSAQLRAAMFEFDDSSSRLPLHGSCSISPGTFSTEDKVRWTARASGGEGTKTYLWEGDDSDLDDETTSSVLVDYNGAGKKDGTVTIADSQTDIDLQCEIIIADQPITGGSGGGGGGGGCFIATAAYGSYMEPQVEMLRRFRDEKLLTTEMGAQVVELYYTVSPPLAGLIEDSPTLQFVSRILLAPIVTMVDLVQE